MAYARFKNAIQKDLPIKEDAAAENAADKLTIEKEKKPNGQVKSSGLTVHLNSAPDSSTLSEANIPKPVPPGTPVRKPAPVKPDVKTSTDEVSPVVKRSKSIDPKATSEETSLPKKGPANEDNQAKKKQSETEAVVVTTSKPTQRGATATPAKSHPVTEVVEEDDAQFDPKGKSICSGRPITGWL